MRSCDQYRPTAQKQLFLLDGFIVAMLCSVLAASCGLLAWTVGHPTAAPLLFLVGMVWIARRFGVLRTMAGIVSAVLVFAFFVFRPFGSLQIASASARDSLFWMVIGAVALGYVFGERTKAMPPPSGSNRV